MILVIVEPKNEEKAIPLEKFPLTIGRKNCDIILNSRIVSKTHCSLIKKGNNIIIRDENSSNGTFVNSREITEYILSDNDYIRLGKYILQFKKDAVHTNLKETEQDKGNINIQKIDSNFDSEDFFNKSILQSQEPIATKKEKKAKTKTADDADNIYKQRLSLINEISRKLIAVNNLEIYYDTICGLLLDIFHCDRSILYMSNNDKLLAVRKKNKNDRVDPKLGLSKSILNKVYNEKVAVIVNDKKDFTKSMIEIGILSAISIPMMNNDKRVIGVVYLDRILNEAPFTKNDINFLLALANFFSIGYERIITNINLSKELELKGKLSRYHSPKVIEMISQKKEASHFIEEKECTILFSDIVSFTPLSERLTARQIVKLLNEYFTKMTDIVFKYDGTLDKYIGDAIMAIFGAPFPLDNDAESAVLAGLDMIEVLKELNKQKKEEHRFEIRIGINTGTVVTGDLGSISRMDYTVIGDPVNLASRIESGVAKPMGVYIGENTYLKIKDKFNFEEIAEVKVKGKQEKIKAYKVLGKK